MLAELGRRGDAALTRGADGAHEAVHATVLHLRRIVGAVSVALARVTREAQDLVWDYQDVAADLRRPVDNDGKHLREGELRPESEEEPAATGTSAHEGRRPVLRVISPDG